MRVPSCTVLFASKTKGLKKLRQKDERNVVYATMEINFDADGRTVEYKVEQIRRDHLLDHAYALTVHKAQGSEYDYVILPMVPEQMFMWYNNMTKIDIWR